LIGEWRDSGERKYYPVFRNLTLFSGILLPGVVGKSLKRAEPFG
jgi:hypothetical protein